MRHRIERADNLAALAAIASGTVPLIYIDPPFNSGRRQERVTLRTERVGAEDDGRDGRIRVGFGGHRYAGTELGRRAFADAFHDYLGFLDPRLREGYRVLAPDGSFYVHLDPREVHYVKILLDEIFGRRCFVNELIWAYDYGARPRRRWPAKHDNILFYVKDPDRYHFDAEAVEREPYMAPGLVTPEKAARGKLPSDCYSDDTDILTERGWLRFANLLPDDRVASVSPEGALSFVRPSRLHAYHHEGSMVQIRSKTVDLLVTPNHRMYVRAKHQPEYGFIEAGDLEELGRRRGETWHVALLNHVEWEGVPAPARIELPPCDYKRRYCAVPLPSFELGDWCEFLGLYLAEGSTTEYADRKEVYISQQKQKNLDHIGNLIRRMGLTCHYNGRAFVICNRQLFEQLRPLGRCHERSIPRPLLALRMEYLQRLYQGLMMGDGSGRRKEEVYVTASPSLADDVQELLFKLGNNANIRQRPAQRPGRRTKYVVAKRVSRESFIFPELHVRVVEYSGMVYCCTVEPYHTVVVRRNGKPAVCGNCWWHTIVSPTGKEKTGYPTQKPLGVLKRIVAASSRPGDLVLDFFAGSGTTGAAALALGRRFHLIDDNPEALAVMAARFAGVEGVEWVGWDGGKATTDGADRVPPMDNPETAA